MTEEFYTNNELKNLISYDDQGRILYCQNGPDDSLKALQEASIHNTVFSQEAATDEGHFVDIATNEIKHKGNMPTKGHIFDYSQGLWAFDISLAKAEKWRAIKEKRTEQEFSNFDWGGYSVQCDEVSQRRLQGAVQMAAISPSIIIDWTMEDNSVVSLTAPQVIEMGTALGLHVTATHERGRMLRQLINDATTETQLDLINW
tara:strand:- start:388 stop:993 length:606 start_codon:yes stop_codon:yes gene_type:complete